MQMQIAGTLLSLSLLLPSAATADWQFEQPRVIAQANKAGEWLQLQSSGRKNIAAVTNRIGITYERYDKDRAEIYLATLETGRENADFRVLPVSERERPHDPFITVSGERFVLGWVDNAGAWVRIENGDKLSEPVQIKAGSVGELTLAADSRRIYCFWSEKLDGGWRIMARTLTVSDGAPVLSEPVAVTPVTDQTRQRNPAATAVDKRVYVAWQDRTTGTSILYAAVSKDGLNFGKPETVNETIVKSATWGKGSSAIDGVFGKSADDKLVLVWLDKRSSRSGYKVYASVNRSLKKNRWKLNQKVQDAFGDFTPQWNATLSDSATGRLTAAWSDSREESPDIWIADYQGGLWNENQVIEAAATDLEETDPALVIDAEDRLHIVWLVSRENSEQKILYARGRR